MMTRRNSLGKALNTGFVSVLIIALISIAGCAVSTPTKQLKASDAPNASTPVALQTYTGRISLVIEPDASSGAAGQSFSGGFELRGNASSGELDLLTPLGQIVMQLRWQPDRAIILRGEERQIFANAQDLIQRATGAALSLEQLFAWLRGEDSKSNASAWQVDLANHTNGRIIARRSAPTPAVLRIALSRE